MVWCGVPKALLPKGKGQDVYPRVQVNGRAMCVVCTRCVVCVRWSSLLCPFVVAAGPVRLGGARVPALAAAHGWHYLRAVPPRFGLRAVALWARRVPLPTALCSGPVLQVSCFGAATALCGLPPPWYQLRGYVGAAPSSSAAAAEPRLIATTAPLLRSLCSSLQPVSNRLPI